MQKLLCIGVAWLALLPYQVVAQAPFRQDSTAVLAAVAAATQQYTRRVRPESVLFNGPEYVDNTQPGTIGHPFFLNSEPQLGSITYRSAHFAEVPLRYDLVLDQVVMTYPGQALAVALVPGKITSFALGSHQFVRLLADSAAGSALPTGFYEVLQSGQVGLLAHHTKQIQRTTVQQDLRLEFKQTDRLFIRTARASAEVAKLKDLLAMLPTHKADVQRYARQQKLRFSAAQREASALSALRYYYTLLQ
ncbi:MAG: hypothetical protein ACRYG7_49570 [Janthinobacterium lividum]